MSKKEEMDEKIEDKKDTEKDIPEENTEESLSIEEEKLQELEQEKEELRDKYLRTLANYENLRKRVDKEKKKVYNYAMGEVFGEILSILDDFERAFKTIEVEGANGNDKEDYQSFIEGMRLVHNNLKKILKNYSIERFHSKGDKFDPSRHEAVQVINTKENEEDTVVEEVECGYKMNDRILRPAKVIVAKNKEEQKEDKDREDK